MKVKQHPLTDNCLINQHKTPTYSPGLVLSHLLGLALRLLSFRSSSVHLNTGVVHVTLINTRATGLALFPHLSAPPSRRNKPLSIQLSVGDDAIIRKYLLFSGKPWG